MRRSVLLFGCTITAIRVSLLRELTFCPYLLGVGLVALVLGLFFDD